MSDLLSLNVFYAIMKFMKLEVLECQKCHGILKIDKDLMHAHCPYCGSNYLIESGQLTLILSEKEKTKRIVSGMRIIEQNKWKIKLSEHSPILAYFLLILFALIFTTLLEYFDSDTYKISKLNKTENAIIRAINRNDYKKALSELSKLTISDDLSKNDKKIWKEKIEKYEKLIPEKQREYDLSKPDNILAPLDAKKFSNKTGDEAKQIFENAGFQNIKMVEINGSGGLFKKDHCVDHIDFGGKTDFTTKDYINKKDKITIYYYSN